MTTPRPIARLCPALALALLLTSATGAHAAFIPLTATLTGTQEVPPVSSPGFGSAAFILDDVGRTLVTAATFGGLSSPTISVGGTSGHIHLGPPGVVGPIIHPFASAPLGVTAGAFTDIWTGLTDANIAALLAGETYINIHTAAFPGGEIRGQIVNSIPEPSSLLMSAAGILGLLGGARFRRRALHA